MSLIYITLGALLDVWSGIWYWYLHSHADEVSQTSYFWCAGFFLTGLTLLIIGLALGQIGRAARHAELPPPEATPASSVIHSENGRSPNVPGGAGG